MTKRITQISAMLFVGVFVFAIAFTITAGSASATICPPCDPYDCCDIMDGETVVGWGIWYIGGEGQPGHCRCAPFHPSHNENNCRLWCPPPR